MGRTQKRKRHGNEHTKTVSGKEHDAVRTPHQNSLTDMKDSKWRDLWTPEWVGLLVIGIMLIIVPYFRGLYFDTDMMVVEQVLCLLLLVTGIWKLAQYVRTRSAQNRSSAHFSGVRTDVLYNPRHLFIFALLIPYLIGLWTAVAPYDNWLQLFRYFAYGIAFFIVAEALSRKPGADLFLQLAMQISIGWTALFAVAAALGQVTFMHAVWNGRLSSVFQYPNTFGIILAVGIVGGLLLTLRRTWWVQAIGGIFLFPMGYVFLLTLSRGAWLFFLIIYLLGMLLLPVRVQWVYFIHSVPLAAGVGLLLLGIGTQLEGASAGAVWTWMVMAMGVGAAGYPVLVRFLTGRLLSQVSELDGGQVPIPARWRGLVVQLVLPAVIAVVLGGALFTVLKSSAVQEMLPDTIAQRVTQINLETHSVLERGYFNEDALEIYRDHPVFGTGGGGWRALFQQYQDYPYWSTQSHNFFSQLIVETGTIGVLLYAVIVIYYLWRGFRWYARYGDSEQRVARAFFLVVMLGLFSHSAIDFNMSFGYVGFLIFLTLAGWQAPMPMKQNSGYNSTRNENQLLKEAARPFHPIFRALPIPVRLIQPVTFLSLLFIVGLMVFPIHNYSQAEALYRDAGRMLEDGDVPGALNELETIIQKSPYHPSYHLTYGSVLVSIGQQQQDEQVLQKGVEHLMRAAELASTQPQHLAQVAQNLMRAGEMEDAFDLIRQALQCGPWDIELYPLLMEMAYEIGEQRLAKGEKATAAEVWQAGLNAFKQIGTMRESLNEFPETLNKGRAFSETEEMKLLAGKLHYRTGQFQASAELLNQFHESQNEDIRRQAILWSMAAQLQMGVPVEQTKGYSMFVQHPDWGDELRQILMLETLGLS